MAQLLSEAGADKDKADEDGSTALMSASCKGHLLVARLLCEAGADKGKADEEGWTADQWRTRRMRMVPLPSHGRL